MTQEEDTVPMEREWEGPRGEPEGSRDTKEVRKQPSGREREYHGEGTEWGGEPGITGY